MAMAVQAEVLPMATEQQEEFRGCVTTFEAIAGKPSLEVARLLGFNGDALRAGYKVWRLNEKVELGEFEWYDSTAYSGGWHFDPSIDEFVKRYDERRATLGRIHGYNEARVDAKLARFMEVQRIRLSVRSGPAQVVKVRARVPDHTTGYPDAEVRTVRQWNLLKDKKFVEIANVGPGERCLTLSELKR
jgi:hypothetical protein